MKRTIVLLAAVAVVGCSATPHRIVELPTGEQITLVLTPSGDEAVRVPCEWYQEHACRRQMRYICGSDFTVLFFEVGHFVARCWNPHLPWVETSGIYACSNGGTTIGNGVSFERQANGIEVVFAQRARVDIILELYEINDPAFRYTVGDDWAGALCWGGVWRMDNVAGFLRYLRDQGAAIERTDDGAFNIRRARP
jgi:hypothetical protein